jgi:hypothetical protein
MEPQSEPANKVAIPDHRLAASSIVAVRILG